MDFEALVRSEEAWLTRRLASALGGDHHAAEDLRQEAFARAWRSLPRDLDPPRQRAWLRRTAANLAVDELRRRGRRPAVALDAAGEVASATAPEEPDAAREALATLGASDRRILLLRFSAGFRHAEIARALDISEEAARKRVARARRAFLTAYRAARRDPTPLVLVVARDEPLEPYARWLERAGARVRRAPERASERDLVLADALLLTGAFSDLHSELYGERPRALRGVPDLEQDRDDLALMRTALAFDLPIVGVCRGHQLLNIASGGTLYQDVVLDGVTGSSHDDGEHRTRHRCRQRDAAPARAQRRGDEHPPPGGAAARARPAGHRRLARRRDRDDRATRPPLRARAAVAPRDRQRAAATRSRRRSSRQPRERRRRRDDPLRAGARGGRARTPRRARQRRAPAHAAAGRGGRRRGARRDLAHRRRRRRQPVPPDRRVVELLRARERQLRAGYRPRGRGGCSCAGAAPPRSAERAPRLGGGVPGCAAPGPRFARAETPPWGRMLARAVRDRPGVAAPVGGPHRARALRRAGRRRSWPRAATAC